MKLLTIEESREIDRLAIDEYGIPEMVLMENAAREVFQAVREILTEVSEKRVCIVAGKGNNGGDAMAVARYVANSGGKVKVFILGEEGSLSESAQRQLDILKKMEIEILFMTEERSWDKLQVGLRLCDLIVDGILGTGFVGELRQGASKLISMINEAGAPVVAIDIPSGVNGNTGKIGEVAVKADITVTLGRPNIGLFFAPASCLCGKIITDGIGIPDYLFKADNMLHNLILPQLVQEKILMRPSDVHKGSCGKTLVVAGSLGMTGAAILASEAVLKVGAGISTLVCEKSLVNIFATQMREVMTLPIDCGGKGFLTKEALPFIYEASSSYDNILIGPGLGREKETGEFIRELVINTDKQVILDADGIFAFWGQGDLLKKCKKLPILTPHLGEMAGLLGIGIDELRSDLLNIAKRAAKEYNAIFVIKSEATIVVYPKGQVYVSNCGNPGMATAGSGDVLAGIIAGLGRQTLENSSPIVGVYIHGRAGDLAGMEKGNCLLAGDISNNICNAVKELVQG